MDAQVGIEEWGNEVMMGMNNGLEGEDIGTRKICMGWLCLMEFDRKLGIKNIWYEEIDE